MTKTTLFLMLMVLTVVNPYLAHANCDAELAPAKTQLQKNGFAIQYIQPEVFNKLKSNQELSEPELKYLGLLQNNQTYFDLIAPNEFLLLRNAELKEQDKLVQNDGENDLTFQLKPRSITEPLKGVERIYGQPYLQRIELPEFDESKRSRFRNLAQKLYYIHNMNPQIPLVIATGGAGSGKTYGAVLASVNLMERGKNQRGAGEYQSKVSKRQQQVEPTSLAQQAFKPIFQIHSVKDIVVTRRPIEMGEPLGFLPGDEIEKMLPFLRPLITNYFEITRQRPNENSFTDAKQLPAALKLLPYSHIRGATVKNSAMIIDEGQNIPEADLRTLLTRTGEGSKFLITGDDGQIDDPENLNYENNALAIAWKMSRDNLIWTAARIRLPDSVRSELTYTWQKLWDAKDQKARAEKEAAQ